MSVADQKPGAVSDRKHLHRPRLPHISIDSDLMYRPLPIGHSRGLLARELRPGMLRCPLPTQRAFRQ